MSGFLDIDMLRWHVALDRHGAPGVALLCALIYHAGLPRYGRQWPGMEIISRDSGLSIDAARRILLDFVALGMLDDGDDEDPPWFTTSSGLSIEDTILDGAENYGVCDFSWRTKVYSDELTEGVDPR